MTATRRRPTATSNAPYVIAVIWLATTISLASWWLRVGLSLPSRHTMFVWEGAAFIVLLVAGGVTMLTAVRREHRRRQAVETFFMSFTHDLKTSLASVQLQAEGLQEEWPAGATREPLDRLLRDTVRLQIQLENSLFVAQADGRLLRERIDVRQAVDRLARDWPELRVTIEGSAAVLADARALDAVLRNLLQNSVIHGEATTVEVRIDPLPANRVCISLADDGTGVAPERMAQLGKFLGRLGESSSTGVGLFVCERLVRRMGGTTSYRASASGRGLTVVIELPGTEVHR